MACLCQVLDNSVSLPPSLSLVCARYGAIAFHCLPPPFPFQVAGLCQILDKDLTDRTKTSEVDVEPLLDTSYTSLFVSEAERRLKQVGIVGGVGGEGEAAGSSR